MLPCIHKHLVKNIILKMTEPIPNFPDSRLFTINDFEWYYKYYLKNGLNPYVDIHPENMLAWLNISNNLSISKLDNSFVLNYTNILDNNHNNIIPIANSLKDSTIERIMLYLHDNNLPLELHEIPSIICDKLDQNKWQITDDRDSFEYILDTNQQSTLRGNVFYHRRRNIGIFERMYPNESINVKYYNVFNDNVKKVFLHHIATMPFNSREESSINNLAEPIAIRNNIKYALTFKKKALIITINGEIVSIAMISYLDKNTAAINHIKVNYSIQNIFRYTIYQLAKILNKNGIKEMNFEQDLGIEGMRAFKNHLQPSRFLEKKIIRPRHQ